MTNTRTDTMNAKHRRCGGIIFLSTLLCPLLLVAHPDGHDIENESRGETQGLMTVQTAESQMTSKVQIKTEAGFRVIESNGIPDHKPGEFPRRGNPNAIKPQSYEFRMTLKPVAADEPVQRMGYWWGVGVNGVPFEPGTGEAWNNDMRSGWRYEAATGFLNLGLDEHNAHVQPNGAYHYHAMPTGLVEKRGGDRDTMVLVAWSADGFPVYTSRAHSDPRDAKSALKEMTSSYQLKKGERPGAPEGPGGVYDGRFTQDFTFVEGAGDLDECNGRFGVTPEFPEGTYYYCISAKFPFVARLWRGEPDESFRKNDAPPGGARSRQAPPGGQPRGIMEGTPLPGQEGMPLSGPRMPMVQAIDLNGDGTIDSKEIDGAVIALKKLDRNGDGNLTPDEYRGGAPGGRAAGSGAPGNRPLPTQ
jgi:hypothetical protein